MLTALLLFPLLLVALLAMPIGLTFRASWPQGAPGYVRLRWAFGLVRLQLPLSPAYSPAPAERLPAAKARKPRGKRGKGPDIMAALRHPLFRRRVMRYLRDCWAALRKRELQLRLRIGLDDPADTGQLWAVMGPLAALLANNQGASFEIAPEFAEQTFELEGSGSIEFVPLQLLYLTLAMLLSPPVRQGLRQ